MAKRTVNPNATPMRRGQNTGNSKPTGKGAKVLDTSTTQRNATDQLVEEIKFAQAVDDPRHRHPWDNDRTNRG